MQSARLCAARWNLIASGMFALLVAPIAARTQTVVGTQQQANEQIRKLSASIATPEHDYVIGRGDLITVEVFDIPELTRDLRVSQTGSIGMPLVPVRLYVAGLTEMQLQQKIAEILEANGLVSHPQVMVSVKEKKSKPITVVGAVTRAMVYQADRPVTLVQVLAEAGGISADAGDVVIVTRSETAGAATADEPPEIGPEDAVAAGEPAQKNKNGAADKEAAATQNSSSTPPPIIAGDAAPPLPNTITVNLTDLLERGDTQNNIPLEGGDVVTVPHAGIVYALGAVQHPGGFVSSNDRAQLSTLKLLALAGGLTNIAKKDRAVIIRKDSMGKQQSIPIDLGKIVEQKTEDVRLQPSDILYIPTNGAKAAIIRAGEIGIVIGSALAIYRLGTGR